MLDVAFVLLFHFGGPVALTPPATVGEGGADVKEPPVLVAGEGLGKAEAPFGADENEGANGLAEADF